MKTFLIILVTQIQASVVLGQIDSASKALLFDLIQNEQRNDQITYTERISEKIIQKLKHFLGGQAIVGEAPFAVKVTLSLDKTDQYYLRTKLNGFQKLIWDDNLFPNSNRIPVDSMWGHISKRNEEFMKIYRTAVENHDTTITNHRVNEWVKYTNTLQFAPPIYLKNKRVVIFYLLRLCGSECGIEELAAYRWNNGQYKKWFNIAGGAF